jgi:hypothetical protein
VPRKKKPPVENIPEDISAGLAEAGDALSSLLPDITGMGQKKKPNYQARYAREKARAKARGFNSPYQERKYRKQAKAASERGEAPAPVSQFVKFATLAKFGITEDQFNRMRKANRAHIPEGRAKASIIQKYRLGVDRQTKNFSTERVGYIVSYYYAVANDNTNFYSITPSRRFMYEGTARLRKWREWQARYLVMYAGIYDIDVFDSRYGDGSYVGSIGKGEKK